MKTMELFLWRHADALAGSPDAQRELSPLGHEQARRVAEWLMARAPADLRLLVSPAARARQTAAYFQGNKEDIQICPQLYDSLSPDDILTLLEWPFLAAPTLVVGHQPLIGALAARLLSDSSFPGAFRKSALWCLHVEHGQNNARLIQIVDGDMNLQPDSSPKPTT